MEKIRKEATKHKYKPLYKEKKPLFSEKEIIFRFDGSAKNLRLSSRFQLICLCVFIFISSWVAYSYYMYNRSGNIIQNKDTQIDETRDAYLDLMTEFMALNKNITSIIGSVDGKSSAENLKIYKNKVQIVEDKIKSIISQNDWVDTGKLNEKTDINAALLQRDIVISERDAYREHLEQLLRDVEDIKKAEYEVLKRVEEVAGKEIAKIKGAITDINKPLRAQNLYYNPLANKKNDSKGGPYVPPDIKLKDKKLLDKTSVIFQELESLEYYKKMIVYVPIGQPVWSYFVSSKFGGRSDPFTGSAATHKGIDLSSRTGNKVKTMAKGQVTKAEYNDSYGNFIEIDHGNGFTTKYAHLHKMYVKSGVEVDLGEAIGEVGSTGRSTGPHLHYEVMYRGEQVNPLLFMKIKV